MLFSQRLVIMVLLVGAVDAESWAFPGPPMTLLERWNNSSLVGYVDVTNVADRKSGNRRIGQLVTLSLRQSVKQPNGKPIQSVEVFTVMGSPYPFPFRKGQRLLVFLRFDDERGMYTPVAFEGCQELDSNAFQLYQVALKRLDTILETTELESRNRKLIDWSVDCATNPVTRKDGVLGLSQLLHKTKASPTEFLTVSHQEQLIGALTSEKPPQLYADRLAKFLRPYPNLELDEFLLESLRSSHKLGWRNVTRTAVEDLPGRLGIELTPSAQQRKKEWGELLSVVYYQIDRRAEPKKYEEAKERYHILWGALSREVYDQCNRVMNLSK